MQRSNNHLRWIVEEFLVTRHWRSACDEAWRSPLRALRWRRSSMSSSALMLPSLQFLKRRSSNCNAQFTSSSFALQDPKMLHKFVVKLESSKPGYGGSLKSWERERERERRFHVTFPMLLNLWLNRFIYMEIVSTWSSPQIGPGN